MSSLSRLTAALGSATNEFTVAAASLNFDFSLMKVEVPVEFQSIGGQLSSKRRNDAESGAPHRTARILGALFEDVLPATPRLVKAYGTRVSEILDSANQKGPDASRYGMFKGFTGADGTSIWAAATSGPGALQIQLLTCMLARLWEGPEATSVWAEIIKERKKEIAAKFENEEALHFKTMNIAMQPDISRAQLAEWDASARAWLRTADMIKAKEQTKFRLILENIDAPVNSDMKVYSSVMAAWKIAVSSMEAILEGKPQGFENAGLRDGALLLGLCAWHLYPNLLVLGKKPVELSLNDPLMPSGVTITIGLQRPDEDHDRRGIYWSLSLAHLRYYGRPVETERAFNLRTSRLTFEELAPVIFGSLIHRWKNLGSDPRSYAGWFEAFYDALLQDEGNRNPENSSGVTSRTHSLWVFKSSINWLRMLINAATAILETKETGQSPSGRLCNLGIRHGHRLLGDSPADPGEELFGLCNPSILLSIMKGPEEQITYLRHIAKKRDLNGRSAYIRYVDTRTEVGPRPFQYASARPQVRSKSCLKDRDTHSSTVSENLPESQIHRRWLHCQPPREVPRQDMISLQRSKRKYPFSAEDNDLESRELPHLISSRVQAGFIEIHVHNQDQFVSDLQNPMVFSTRRTISNPAPNLFHSSRDNVYQCYFGDPNTAALFVQVHGTSPSRATYSKDQYDTSVRYLHNIDDIRWALQAGLLDMNALWGHILIFSQKNSQLCHPLRALTTGANIYNLLPGATVAIEIMKRPILATQWALTTARQADSGSFPLQPFPISRTETFACVAYFESGHCDIQPHNLHSVMAMSSGDSIFVAAPLLCDPVERPHPYELRRIVGNVGRAGITMLTPPKSPMMQEAELENWNVINHVEFDGNPEDNFEGTTLHLYFTNYNVPISIGDIGGQDPEVSLLETVISVQDGNKWVGDIDPLSALESRWLKWLPRTSLCRHKMPTKPRTKFVAIDNWMELTETMESMAVVRAHKNWTARLAATSFSVMRGEGGKFYTVVCPEDMCWECSFDALERISDETSLLSQPPTSQLMCIW
jgi:hypothetical protein